jgi:curli biogenesis system outer membrane secretion channel CsgG
MMFKRKNIIISILIVLTFLISSIPAFTQERPEVAVVAITSTASGYSWRSDSPLAIAATDLMINALVNSNRFRLFERAKLDAIMQEQNFQHFSGMVDQSTAVQLGKMIGVGAIVTGTVTNVSISSGSGFQIGPVKVRKRSAKVNMTIRFVDVTTGEILYSASESCKDSASSVSARLPGSIPGGIGFSEESAADILTAIEEICDNVVESFVEKMDEKIARIESAPLEGYVVQVRSTSSGNITQVYINLGESSTIKVGDKVRIYREGEVIRDPKTNEILDRELTIIATGTVRVVKEKLSEAMITEKFSSREIRQEDIVQVVR